MELKKCTKCGEDKPQTADYFSRCKRNGLASRCKACAKSYYESKKHHILEQKKIYHLENKKEVLKKKKEYYETNKERLIIKQKDYYESNKEKQIETNRIIRIRRKKSDPIYKVACNLRGRLKDILRGKKSAPTLKLLGCSLEYLRSHLESQFKPGMTWGNYGPVWHIDHIKPFAAFDNILDPVQQREVCHYTNLQPLFAKENFIKGSTWTEEERSG